MLNLFPIQFLAPLAYFILRIGVGIIFLYLGKSHIKNNEIASSLDRSDSGNNSKVWFVGIFEIIIGLFFLFGFLTQITSLLSMLYVLFSGRLRRKMPQLVPGRLFLILLFFASLSLFITGAGAFAFDLPI